MSHWRDVKRRCGEGDNCDINLVEVCYEDLVEDPVGGANEIFSHLDLETPSHQLAEEVVDTFHNTKRAVHTHSMSQVRQKIFSHSVGSWKKFRPQVTFLFLFLF